MRADLKLMSYITEINKLLKPQEDKFFNKTVLDLFAGCGGLSLGFEALGFKTIGYEMNGDACATYNRNLLGECQHKTLEVGFNYPKAQVVVGGPPCQPFSVVGKQLGLKDERDGFPIMIDAINQVRPKIFLIENVKGMMYRNKKYLSHIQDVLGFNGQYKVDIKVINARYFGVPQNRERIFIVGHSGEFEFPSERNEIITVGKALDGNVNRHVDKESMILNQRMDALIAKYERASKCITPRDLHLDKPARTLTCRNLSGSTGDMIRLKMKDGKRRKLFKNEAATLQSFPKWYKFHGNETSALNQIGNAVPPMLAYYLAREIKKKIQS